MDVIAAYENVGTYRGAAELCGTTHKTVRRFVRAHQAEQASEELPDRKGGGHNYDTVADLVAKKVAQTQGKISAKRLLPAARAAGYAGSPRNFRRLVAEAKHSTLDRAISNPPRRRLRREDPNRGGANNREDTLHPPPSAVTTQVGPEFATIRVPTGANSSDHTAQ